jgi:dTDP-4-amino-4,6-dideoxygalactose transaminase
MSSLTSIPYVNIAALNEDIKAELLEAVSRVLDSGQFILGREVEVFEKQFASLCGVRYAVGLNSGTDALIFALRALGVGVGDEVITVPNSFVASTSCIVLVGARPVFVDVREDYNIDTSLIEKAITPRTKAILPVHLTGRPADMAQILDVASRHGLWVVEDCAQAVLAEYQGQRVGSFGAAGCFSLHPLKTLNACGDGGVVTTNDEALYEKVKLYRNLGLKTRDNCVIWSGNSRLDTLQAAILLVKLKHLHRWTEKRRSNAAYYQKALAGIPRVQVPLDQPHEMAVYHTFVIQAGARDRLRQYLQDQGIGTAIHYPIPIHLQEAASSLGYRVGSFPVAEAQAKRILSLPVYSELEQWQLEHVAEAVRRFFPLEVKGDRCG